jgi:hypothetical protein
MKKSCSNCHFLIYNFLSRDTNRMEQNSLTSQQRSNIKALAKCYKNNLPFYIDCNSGIWSIKTFSTDSEIY